MAVIIDEFEVQVQESRPQAQPAVAPDEHKGDMDLREALELQYERMRRLRTD